MGRSIVIGDVHGCLNELKALVQKLDYRQGDDHIIFVGDLIDRGPYPVETVAYAMQLGAYTIRGNHEDNALRWLLYEDRVAREPGFKNPMEHQAVRERRKAKSGTRELTPEAMELRRQRQEARLARGEPAVAPQTPRQRKAHTHVIPEERKAEWRQLSARQRSYLDSCVYVDLSADWYVVHGGLETKPLIEEQDAERIMRLRYVWPDTGHMAPSESGTLDQPTGSVWWMEAWRGPMNVIYGHAVHSLAEPRIDVCQTTTGSEVRCFGIDTGCCYGGRLTAMVFADENSLRDPTFVQVESEQPRIHLPPGVPS